MKKKLPDSGGDTAHVTGKYGEPRAKDPHKGVDFNYNGGQTGINLTHPTVYSPIDGTVDFTGGNYGTVTIKDRNGNFHKILHMDSQLVEPGQQV